MSLRTRVLKIDEGRADEHLECAVHSYKSTALLLRVQNVKKGHFMSKLYPLLHVVKAHPPPCHYSGKLVTGGIETVRDVLVYAARTFGEQKAYGGAILLMCMSR
jgi:hypothetical protein